MHRSFSRHLWLVLRYAILNLEVIQAAISLAKQEGLLVSLDLASFEMVRKFKPPLMKLLESGNIDLCFANQDEATELQFFLKKASVLIALAMAAGTGGVVAGELELNHECSLMHWLPEDFESKLQGDTLFERQSSQFALAVSDIVLINITVNRTECYVKKLTCSGSFTRVLIE
ncbi:hypothetical protein AHAS_Ahas13G0151900 [Arachis hypogaea]